MTAKVGFDKLSACQLEQLNGRAVILAPSEDCAWLASRMTMYVQRALEGIIGQTLPVEFVNMPEVDSCATL